MGISSSLNAGVMGLAANATKLATISENIANSETAGYKRVDSEFNSMVLDFASGAFTAGGVRADTIRFVDAEGPIQSTSNPTDITVAGGGFLPMTDLNSVNSNSGTPSLFLATTGSFRPDEDGFLKTQNNQYLMGWPIDSDGNVVQAAPDSVVGLEPINVRQSLLSTAPTTQIDLGVNLPASASEVGVTPVTYEAPVEYFDNLGQSQVITFAFTPDNATNPNQWNVEMFDSASATPTVAFADFAVEFDDTSLEPGTLLNAPVGGTGATYNATTGNIEITMPHGPVNVFVGFATGESAMTQIAADFSPIGISKNGVASGNLQNVEINEEGFLEAVFDTGFRQAIYQVPVADVPNKNGLRAVDGQAYQVSQESGGFFLYGSGEGPVGTTVGFALEGSTTEVAAELTALIETQRAYSSNARIIQTVDEVLEETTNLKR
ncbi:MAG: flagellar hook-basal body complex protein [Pseudomonadota bacterium]